MEIKKNMTISITHSKTSGKSDGGDASLIRPSDWNAGHSVSGVQAQLTTGTFQVPQLIEAKTGLSGATTTTFSNLNGDSDVEYYIIFELDVSSGGSNKSITLKPNNVATNQTSNNFMVYNVSTAVGGTATLQIGQSDWNSDGHIHGEVKLQSATGKDRLFSGTTIFVPTSPTDNDSWHINSGRWNENSTNITSLVIAIASGGTFTGTIKLYKMVDLVIS